LNSKETALNQSTCYNLGLYNVPNNNFLLSQGAIAPPSGQALPTAVALAAAAATASVQAAEAVKSVVAPPVQAGK